jgi:hypothetical protein
VRSALNRHFSDNNHGRPFLGVDVAKSIETWGLDQDREKRVAGKEIRLQCNSLKSISSKYS